MTRCPGCGWPHFGNRLAEAVWAIGREPTAVAFVADHVVNALHHWNGGRNAIIAAEVERRCYTWFTAERASRTVTKAATDLEQLLQRERGPEPHELRDFVGVLYDAAGMLMQAADDIEMGES